MEHPSGPAAPSVPDHRCAERVTVAGSVSKAAESTALIACRAGSWVVEERGERQAFNIGGCPLPVVLKSIKRAWQSL